MINACYGYSDGKCHSISSVASIADVLFPEKAEIPKVDINCF